METFLAFYNNKGGTIMKIATIRPVLLSAPYGDANNAEVQIHLRSGYRTCSLVEITLENGTTGLGEGYLGVFAPQVFTEIVNLVAPHLIGMDISNTNSIYQKACSITDYWSYQGAARHVISAVEIATMDAKAKLLQVPAYDLLGGAGASQIPLYGSGGDSTTPQDMEEEFRFLQGLGIETFKIRGRNFEPCKVAWCLERGKAYGISVAVDMAQNLKNPGQSIGEILTFLNRVAEHTHEDICFLEEALGCQDIASYGLLRQRITPAVCGGEVVTTAGELCHRVEQGYYDFVQPDATVIGGMQEVHRVFATCCNHGTKAVVHCWGGAVCMMANYHVAFANGADLVEYPMPHYPIRQALMTHPLEIRNGCLQKPTAIGLGVNLTPEIEVQFPFRPDAVYDCSGAIAPTCKEHLFAAALQK